MDKAKELLSKMKDARTWKEAEITMAEVASVLIDFIENGNNAVDQSEIKRMKSKIERLTESNKQLMAENKKLKGK